MEIFYETLSRTTPYVEDAWLQLNLFLDNFEKWQILIFGIIVFYLFNRLWDLYDQELDKLEKGVWPYIKKKVFNLTKSLPFVQGKILSELDKNRKALEDDVIKMNKGQKFIKSLPENGMSESEVLRLTDEYLKLADDGWKKGALSGCVYGASDELVKLTTQVYSKFAWTNPMHADVFPDVRKMEAEVVRWVCTLFHGDAQACGTMTSGGTESIMLACRAYRERAVARGIRHPEIVCPVTAHAAFDKAADAFCMKIRHVPVDPKTKKVSAKTMRSYINGNTCMIVGSAPHFPHGAIDPIEDLSKLAVKYDIPLHVDACLGGFLIAFMSDAGFKLPAFDFRLPGVTSISCDTHKYGYTPKGSSVIMYKNKDYRKYQYFSAIEWTGGIYVSPTFAGSRAGSIIAMTWATLAHIGHKSYVKITKDIIDTTRYITNEVRKIPELELMCEPDVSVLAFTSSHFNILHLLDDMVARGWHLNALQNPSGIHIAVTKMHTAPGVAQRLVKDIKECVSGIMKRDDRKLGKVAAIYCSTQSIPDKSLITDVAFMFLDACYNTIDDKKSTANGSSSH